MTLRYLDVCSGISAPSAAWKPLGWEALCFAEIEAAPRAVLSHHYPDVPLRGDFTEIKGDEYGPVDLLVGGTPCQDFSVAGLRKGLDGERGNLSLEYLRLADRARPRWLVWENVPGVLSIDGGRAFGAILGGLAELGYGFAYRVLDAQHFGVPQRRRRVFVVGYIGDWRRAAAVLFERHSLSGHPAPRREKGEGVAAGVAGSLGGGSNERGWNNSLDVSGAFIPAAHSLRAQSQMAHREDVDTLICGALTPGAHPGSYNGQDAYTGHLIAHSLRAEGFDASEDGTGRGTPLVPVAFSIMPMNSGKDYKARETDVAQPLMAGGNPASAQGGDLVIADTLTSNGDAHSGFRDEKGLVPVYPINTQIATRHKAMGRSTGFGISEDGEPSFTLQAGHSHAIGMSSAVRRLTPRECERLQGFPDDFTLVPYRKGMMADGPRYKMLGNSMAVPVVRWIGERIEAVEALAQEGRAAA